jgi:pimeloyl-ACP methyl ester carboxylesterase
LDIDWFWRELMAMNGRRRGAGRVGLLAALAVLAGGGLLGAPARAATSPPATAPTTYTGEIHGARFRAEVPAHWNGTLVLWSHSAYYYGFTGPATVELTNQKPVEDWLVAHGYAVAGSLYDPPSGWVVEQAMTDQLGVLDWFDGAVGHPARTIAEGASMGGLVSTLLAERYPDRFDGVLSLGAELAGSADDWNLGLAVSSAFATLLAPAGGLALAHVTDPDANLRVLNEALVAAQATPAGRARLALVGAIGDVSSWWHSLQPPPDTLASRLAQQAEPIANQLRFLLGVDRAGLERLAGGNPSSTVGVRFRRLLAASPQADLARAAYAAAGLNLDTDLARLDAAPRISADPAAAGYVARYGTPVGRVPVPELTVHTTGDGFVIPANEQAFRGQVERHGDLARLRQLYVRRGGHTTFTASEEIVALATLLDRVTTGTWPGTQPTTLNAEACALGPGYQQVFDWATQGSFGTVTPAFTAYRPPAYPLP